MCHRHPRLEASSCRTCSACRMLLVRSLGIIDGCNRNCETSLTPLFCRRHPWNSVKGVLSPAVVECYYDNQRSEERSKHVAPALTHCSCSLSSRNTFERCCRRRLVSECGNCNFCSPTNAPLLQRPPVPTCELRPPRRPTPYSSNALNRIVHTAGFPDPIDSDVLHGRVYYMYVWSNVHQFR